MDFFPATASLKRIFPGEGPSIFFPEEGPSNFIFLGMSLQILFLCMETWTSNFISKLLRPPRSSMAILLIVTM